MNIRQMEQFQLRRKQERENDRMAGKAMNQEAEKKSKEALEAERVKRLNYLNDLKHCIRVKEDHKVQEKNKEQAYFKYQQQLTEEAKRK